MAYTINQVKEMETERLSMLVTWALCELHERKALRVVAGDDEATQAYHPVEFDPFTSDTYYDSSGLVLSFRDGTPQGDGNKSATLTQNNP